MVTLCFARGLDSELKQVRDQAKQEYKAKYKVVQRLHAEANEKAPIDGIEPRMNKTYLQVFEEINLPSTVDELEDQLDTLEARIKVMNFNQADVARYERAQVELDEKEQQLANYEAAHADRFNTFDAKRVRGVTPLRGAASRSRLFARVGCRRKSGRQT